LVSELSDFRFVASLYGRSQIVVKVLPDSRELPFFRQQRLAQLQPERLNDCLIAKGYWEWIHIAKLLWI
jgi:hypothetical protein